MNSVNVRQKRNENDTLSRPYLDVRAERRSFNFDALFIIDNPQHENSQFVNTVDELKY